MLETRSVEDFTLKDLTRELGMAPMAIYTYFPSRTELLVAIADEICLRFVPPEPAETWQQTVLDWLRALKRHADRYPAMPSILGIDGHTSSAWAKVNEPISLLMENEVGIKGKSLLLAKALFGTSVASMFRALMIGYEYMKEGIAYSSPPQLVGDDAHAECLRKTRIGLAGITEDELYEALYAQIVKGIEAFR